MNGELLVFKIWELCKAQGLTKTEFYQRAGVTPSAMTHYKSGTNKPSLDKLLKFAEILNVDPSYLICYEFRYEFRYEKPAPLSELVFFFSIPRTTTPFLF